MRALGLVAVVPLVIILLAVMARASRRRLEIDLRERSLGQPESTHAPSEEHRRSHA